MLHVKSKTTTKKQKQNSKQIFLPGATGMRSGKMRAKLSVHTCIM